MHMHTHICTEGKCPRHAMHRHECSFVYRHTHIDRCIDMRIGISIAMRLDM